MSSNGTAVLSDRDLQHKERAERLLAETLKILNELQAERRYSERSRRKSANIISEVNAILHH